MSWSAGGMSVGQIGGPGDGRLVLCSLFRFDNSAVEARRLNVRPASYLALTSAQTSWRRTRDAVWRRWDSGGSSCGVSSVEVSLQRWRCHSAVLQSPAAPPPPPVGPGSCQILTRRQEDHTCLGSISILNQLSFKRTHLTV